LFEFSFKILIIKVEPERIAQTVIFVYAVLSMQIGGDYDASPTLIPIFIFDNKKESKRQV
jgi:hypothetical protein